MESERKYAKQTTRRLPRLFGGAHYKRTRSQGRESEKYRRVEVSVKLTNNVKGGIIMFEENYMNKYENCPCCGKKLFRVIASSEYRDIFVWCKFCKKEIKVNKRAQEPKC